MRNKRGQFFAIYLVLLTLFMCGMAIWLYYMQNGNVANSLVSPTSLLDIKDKQEIFEIQEKNLIILSAGESGLSENKDINLLKTKFIENVFKPEQLEFRDFIFSNLSLDGIAISPAAVASDDAKRVVFETKGIYEFSIEGNSLRVERKHLGKSLLLKVSDRSKINFITKVDYDYGKSYLIQFNEININK